MPVKAQSITEIILGEKTNVCRREAEIVSLLQDEINAVYNRCFLKTHQL